MNANQGDIYKFTFSDDIITQIIKESFVTEEKN